MCGIAGIFGYAASAASVDPEELLRIREAMADRGPDGAGLWIADDGRIGLAHRRLAIIDLTETGAQPMATADGSLRIVFNGEIYNYRELRSDLESKGYRFLSRSDTEVLLHLYREYGRNMLQRLRGMFAFAIWDERKRGLLLARDPFGIKPLYYADNGSTIRLASQVKALIRGRGVDTTPEPAGHVGFHLWGHVPEPFTLYKGVRSLPAGSALWVDADGRKHSEQFFNVASELAKAGQNARPASIGEMRERLREALLDSVRSHLVADVPVGVFLSAGIDSTTLVGLAKEAGLTELHAVTLGFKEYRGTSDDELPLAERAARHFGAVHHTSVVTREDFEREYRRLLESMDQPSIDGVNSYFVSKAAKEAGLKVVLSGVGGDELFGSYPSFKQIPRMARLFAPFQAVPSLSKGFRRLSEPFFRRITSRKYAGLLEYGGTFGGAYLLRRGVFMPWELPDLLGAEQVRAGWESLNTLPHLERLIHGIDSDHLKVGALESSWYMRNQLLRDTDWASMAHSLEIRTPLVDVELFRAVAPLFGSPFAPTKHDVARTPAHSLPSEILNRRKTGFSIPVRDWLSDGKAAGRNNRSLRGWARRIYGESHVRGRRILAVVTDAFGGHGGIAQYNRNLLTTLAALPDVEEIVVLPRIVSMPPGDPGPKIRFHRDAAGGKIRFVWKTVGAARGHFDLVICGHINLLPVASFFSAKTRAPLVLQVHGIDVWKPHPSALVRRLCGTADKIWSVSQFTQRKMMEWTKLSSAKFSVIPNAIDLNYFAPGPRNMSLVRRHRLEGRKVILLLCRLPSAERYKGADEVISLMPRLLSREPRLTFLIAGDGDDRRRLVAKAEALGVSDQVVFAGFIDEAEKVDYYRLADAFVMPGRGEGFGIVLLEALACGIPVVASCLDGSREAVRGGALGRLVDPDDADALEEAILGVLTDRRGVPDGLDYFSMPKFKERIADALCAVSREGVPCS
jgi:asparagine synthase (glutamine-hydrolysing)